MVIVFSLAAIKFAVGYDRMSRWQSASSFAVSGEGKVVGVPDIARLTMGVITEGGNDAAKLQRENTDKTNKIIAFVNSKGVDEKDIKTEQYSVQPRFEYANCGFERVGATCPPPKIVGYTITQSISVKVRNFGVVGDILSGAVTAGANNVYGPTFEIDDRTKLVDQARGEALAKARESAKAVARAGGFRLGKILSIDEGYYGGETYRSYDAYGKGGDMAVASQANSPSILPGSQDVIITVNVRYEIR